MTVLIIVLSILLLTAFILFFVYKLDKSPVNNRTHINKNDFVTDPEISKFFSFYTPFRERHYREDNQEYQPFLDNLQLLKQQNEGDYLYLGFPGDFNAEKSSLINATPHHDLLKNSNDRRGPTLRDGFVYELASTVLIKQHNHV